MASNFNLRGIQSHMTWEHIMFQKNYSTCITYHSILVDISKLILHWSIMTKLVPRWNLQAHPTPGHRGQVYRSWAAHHQCKILPLVSHRNLQAHPPPRHRGQAYCSREVHRWCKMFLSVPHQHLQAHPPPGHRAQVYHSRAVTTPPPEGLKAHPPPGLVSSEPEVIRFYDGWLDKAWMCR